MVDFKEFDQNGKLHNTASRYFEFIHMFKKKFDKW